jgi:predicted MFS family arabinose efflux permease
MAVTAGMAVANNYYAQPLLATIARHFDVSEGAAGLLITVSQIGYALGLLAVVPLGDLIERRRLLTSLLGLSVVALIAAALSPTLGVLAGSLIGTRVLATTRTRKLRLVFSAVIVLLGLEMVYNYFPRLKQLRRNIAGRKELPAVKMRGGWKPGNRESKVAPCLMKMTRNGK